MNTRTQWMVIGGAVLFMAAGLFAAATALGDELFPIKIGSDAPRFEAVTLPPREFAPSTAGVTKGPGDYTGDVVLLNIWATWCGPCRVEMPSIEKLYQRLGPKGLKVVAVSIDDPGFEQKINLFADELKLTFELLYDSSGRIQQQYQTTGVPETFIIDREGVIRRRVIGAPIGEDDWAGEKSVAFLERLLAEPRP